MAHISTGVEYSLHCLLYLTRPPLGVKEASVRSLAELQGVPNEFLAKLFTKMAKAELVVATEGVKGGFRLAREPNKITVYDVIVAIDGEKALFDCREIRGRCAIFDDKAPAWVTEGVCSIHAVMQMADKAMRNELRQHTLADLAKRTTDKADATYGVQVIEWLSHSSSGRGIKKDK